MEALGFPLWLILSLLASVVASRRGRRSWLWLLIALSNVPTIFVLARIGGPIDIGAAGFLILVAGWPFVILLFALAAPKVSEAQSNPARAPCPHCAEQILRAARVCPHCRSTLDPGWDSKRRYLSRPA